MSAKKKATVQGKWVEKKSIMTRLGGRSSDVEERARSLGNDLKKSVVGWRIVGRGHVSKRKGGRKMRVYTPETSVVWSVIPAKETAAVQAKIGKKQKDKITPPDCRLCLFLI
jgi:hypothetical protein